MASYKPSFQAVSTITTRYARFHFFSSGRRVVEIILPPKEKSNLLVEPTIKQPKIQQENKGKTETTRPSG